MSGGKVVTKAGKVSCSCCAACCMYSAQGLVDGTLVEADLPAAITLLGVGSLSRSGTGYGTTTNGVIFETPRWAKYVGGVRTTQSCLITGDGNFTPGDNAVEDQFADSYIITFNGTPGPSLPRKSLCSWDDRTDIFDVIFDSVFFNPIAQKWNGNKSTAIGFVKQGDQSTPVGTYKSPFLSGATFAVA